MRPPQRSTLFPYTTLFRSATGARVDSSLTESDEEVAWDYDLLRQDLLMHYLLTVPELEKPDHRDRKSTRLNSSHPSISYAVFCLKKKNQLYTPPAYVYPPH